MRKAALALALAGCLMLAGAASAHHGFTGRYDTDRPLFLVGAVTAVSASRPHATITLRVAQSAVAPPSGAERPAELTGDIVAGPDHGYRGQTVTVEFPPVAAFFDLGGKVKAGDTVEIVALRNCSPPHQLRSQWIRVPGREIVKRDGRLSYMVRGCAQG